jgi:hypothetical protein
MDLPCGQEDFSQLVIHSSRPVSVLVQADTHYERFVVVAAAEAVERSLLGEVGLDLLDLEQKRRYSLHSAQRAAQPFPPLILQASPQNY